MIPLRKTVQVRLQRELAEQIKGAGSESCHEIELDI